MEEEEERVIFLVEVVGFVTIFCRNNFVHILINKKLDIGLLGFGLDHKRVYRIVLFVHRLNL